MRGEPADPERDAEDRRMLLRIYTEAVSFHATSLLAVAFGQFSILMILPVIKGYQFWFYGVLALAIFIIVYGVILLLATYFLSRYVGGMRRISYLHQGMDERHRNFEKKVDDSIPYSPNFLRPMRDSMVAGKYDTVLYAGYWLLSLILFFVVYFAP
jgi:hypothetical protein